MEESQIKARSLMEKKTTKTTKRGRNTAQRMKERKEVRLRKQFLMKEIERQGEKHYYVMKKEVAAPESNLAQVEDIFADWNRNFARIKRARAAKPRVRKLSHRAERKEMLKEAREVQGPLTYSQMVRKNLKLPAVEGPAVEEIFGTWMKCIDKMYKAPRPTNSADVVEVFNNWNFLFSAEAEKRALAWHPPLAALECGQPTVLAAASKKQSVEQVSARLLAEGYPLTKQEVTTGSQQLSVRNKKLDLVPFVEKAPVPPIPASKQFTPSAHSQRCLVVNNIPTQSFVGPINKPGPVSGAASWTRLVTAPVKEQSGRGSPTATNVYKAEEIFDQWRHIFTETAKQFKQEPVVFKQDLYYSEWLHNLEEPQLSPAAPRKVKRNSGGSPRASKKAEKKQIREQFIEDDVTDIKDNRRNDFARVTKIKDKKRSDASRNSLGKRVK